MTDTLILGGGGTVVGALVVNSLLAAPYLLLVQRLVLGSRMSWRRLLPGAGIAAAHVVSIGILVGAVIAHRRRRPRARPAADA